MAPSFFSDLGQKIRNVLNNGYQVNIYKIDVQKKGQNITVNGGLSYTPDNKKIGGHLGAKLSFDHVAMGIKGCAETVYKSEEGSDQGQYVFDKSITGEGSANDSFLKFVADYTYHPGSEEVTGHLKNLFKDDLVAFTLATEIKKDGIAMLDSSIVFDHGSLQTGLELGFNTKSQELTKNNIAAQYEQSGYTFYAKVNTTDCIHFSCHTTLKDNIEPAASIEFNPRNEDLQLIVGAKYNMNSPNIVFGAKVNSKLAVGLSIKHRFKDFITFTAAASVDCKNITSLENHKLGASVQIEL